MLAVISDGETVTSVAARFGVHHTTMNDRCVGEDRAQA